MLLPSYNHRHLYSHLFTNVFNAKMNIHIICAICCCMYTHRIMSMDGGFI